MPILAVLESGTGIGGAEINLIRLVPFLTVRGWEVVFIVPGKGALTSELDRRGIRWRVLGAPIFKSTSRYVGDRRLPDPPAMAIDLAVLPLQAHAVRRVLRELHASLLHTNSMLSHLVGGLAARGAGIPCVWHLQDIVAFRSGLGLFRPLLRMAARVLPARVVCISQAVAAQFDGLGLAPKLQVVYNGVDANQFTPDGQRPFRARWLEPGYELVVGQVGRFTPWKGQETLLDLAQRARADRRPFRFVLIGDDSFGEPGYGDQLRAIARQRDLGDAVVFAGWIDDMPGAYRSLDVLVHPVRTPEPFGLTVAEAMACGTPVATFSGGGAGEVIGSREFGWTVLPGDTNALWNGVQWCWENPNEARRMGARARERIEIEFGLERFANSMCQVYETLVT